MQKEVDLEKVVDEVLKYSDFYQKLLTDPSQESYTSHVREGLVYMGGLVVEKFHRKYNTTHISTILEYLDQVEEGQEFGYLTRLKMIPAIFVWNRRSGHPIETCLIREIEMISSGVETVVEFNTRRRGWRVRSRSFA